MLFADIFAIGFMIFRNIVFVRELMKPVINVTRPAASKMTAVSVMNRMRRLMLLVIFIYKSSFLIIDGDESNCAVSNLGLEYSGVRQLFECLI